MKKRTRTRLQIAGLGFAVLTLLSVGYLAFGSWGRIPLVNLTQPQAGWARVVFSPGLAVGRSVFRDLFPRHSLDFSKAVAASAGVLTMGLIGAAAGLGAGAVLFRK